MASLNLTTMDGLLKQVYTKKRVDDLVNRESPLYALMRKDPNFGGSAKKVPAVYGDSPSVSKTFSTAQSNSDAALITSFLVTRVKQYGVCSVDGETIEAAKGNDGAVFEALKFALDNELASVTRQIAIGLYRSQNAAIGQISASATVGSSTILLKNPDDIANFSKGMKIVLAASETAALRNSGATATITGVDRDSGSLYFAGNLTAEIAAAAASDVIFLAGDQSAAGNAKLGPAGLAAWCPSAAPTAGDSFFGVDRSADGTRLGGVRVDGTSLTLVEGLNKLAARMNREGAMPSHVFCSPQQFGNLVNQLSNQVHFTDVSVGSVGFKALEVYAGKNVVKVLADQHCQQDVVWMVEMPSLELGSAGAAPRIMDNDGCKILRDSTTDSYQIRVGAYYNMICYKPSGIGRLAVNA